MRRREFITLIGGAAAWPLGARAQQPERMRRVGVLMNLGSDDAEGQARNAAFLQGLQELGWTVGRNVRIEYRWGAGDAELFRRHASELVALAPDVILAAGGAVVPSLLQATRTIPIVFAGVGDPVTVCSPTGSHHLRNHQFVSLPSFAGCPWGEASWLPAIL